MGRAKRQSGKAAKGIAGIYPAWADTMASISVGAKRLPELLQRLFQVL